MSIPVEKLVAEIDANPDKAIAALSAVNKELDATARDRTAKVKVEADRSQIDQLGQSSRRTSDDVNALSMAGKAAGAVFGGLGNVFKALKFGAIYGGVTMLGGALNGLAGTVGGLVGVLGNLSGLLGVIPAGLGAVLGGVGATALGLAGITKAVSAYTAVQQQNTAGTYAAVQRANQLQAARHNVLTATLAVRDAEFELTQAQKQLAKAPWEARQNLINLRLQAASATLNERQAVLSLQQAQENLNNIQNQTAMSSFNLIKQTDAFTGKVYEVAQTSQSATDAALKERQAQLDVKNAQLGVKDAKNQTAVAQHNLNYAEGQGIKNSDIMVQAVHNVQQAQQALTEAIYQQKQAHAQLNQLIKFGTSATQQWMQAILHLSPVARDFAKFLVNTFLPAFYQMREMAQNGLLPGVEKGLISLLRIFPMLDKHVFKFAQTVGNAFASFMQFWTKPKQAAQLDRTLAGLNGLLSDMLKAAIPLSRVFVAVTRAATPMTRMITKDIVGALRQLAHWTNSARGQNTLAKFFHTAYQFGRLMVGILKPVAGIFKGITTAATPLAKWMLRDLGGYLKGVSDNINSITGQKSLKKYFNDQRPAIKSFSDLIGSLLKALFKPRNNKAFIDTLDNLRTKLVPAISRLLDQLSKSNFGPEFATFLGHVADGITAFVKHDGALTMMIKGINKLADALNALSKATHGKSTDAIMSAIAVMGGVKLGEKIPGVGGLISGGVDKSKELLGSSVDDKLKQILDDRLGKKFGFLKVATPVEVVNWPKNLGGSGADNILGGGTKNAEKDAAKNAERKGVGKFIDKWLPFLAGATPATLGITYGPLLAAGGDQGGRNAMTAGLNRNQKSLYQRQTAAITFLEKATKALGGRPGDGTALATLLGKNPQAGLAILNEAAKIYGTTTPKLLKWLNVGGGEFQRVAAMAQKYNDNAKSQASLNNLLLGPSIRNVARELNMLPPVVQTKVETPGAVTSVADIKRLQHQYSLTPKQVRSLIKLSGVKASVDAAGHVKAAIDAIPKNPKVRFDITAGYSKDAKRIMRREGLTGTGYVPAGNLTAGKHRRATGGRVLRGEPYIVGERRPELFIPESNGMIMPRVPQSNGEGVTDAQLERVLRKVMENAKGDTNIEVNTTNEVAPLHVAKAIAWSLR